MPGRIKVIYIIIFSASQIAILELVAISFIPGNIGCRKVIIISGKVFGLSSALYLLKSKLNDIIIINNSNPLAPNRDVTKILRIDYLDRKHIKDIMRLRDS